MNTQSSTANLDKVLGVLENMRNAGIGKEHLVAMWLFAGRAKDYQKIAMFREAEFLDEAKLFDILERHDLMSKWNREKWRFADEE